MRRTSRSPRGGAAGDFEMACFRPFDAWASEGKPMRFEEKYEGEGYRPIKLPCGKCVGCMQVRTRDWAIRCMHEAQLYQKNCFVTLTYKDETWEPSLNHKHFQDFMRSLRKQKGYRYFDVTTWSWVPRFFMGGEYGEKTGRPHFHAILFGVDFHDKVKHDEKLFRSKTLEKLWPHGYSTIGAVTYESAAYVAKYCQKKIWDEDAARKYYSVMDIRTGEVVQVTPEFGHMSLKPGIGYAWFKKFWREVYLARDGVVLQGGKMIPPPKYYDKLMDEVDSDLMEFKSFERYERSKKFLEDTRPERLIVREKCVLANLERKRRKNL